MQFSQSWSGRRPARSSAPQQDCKDLLASLLLSHKFKTNNKQPYQYNMSLSSLNLNLFNRKVDFAPEESLNEEDSSKQISTSLYRRSIVLGESPSRPQACLGVAKNLFSNSDDAIPIVTALSGETFRDLQVRKILDGIVLEDSVIGTPVAAVTQSFNHKFTIYSSRPSYSTQPSVNIVHTRPLFVHSTVERVGNVLQVVLACNDEPTYTIHNVQNVANRTFYNKHVIKEHGEPVASTRYGPGNSYLLQTSAGVDPITMILLAAIADQLDNRE